MSDPQTLRGWIMASKEYNAETHTMEWKPNAFWHTPGNPDEPPSGFGSHQPVCKALVNFTVPKGWDPIKGEITILQKKIAEVRAAAEKEIMETEQAIANLLALPAPEAK